MLQDAGAAGLKSPRRWRELALLRPALLAAVLCLLYYLAARLGLALLNQPESIALFWPASGLAAGVLVALGRSACVPVMIAVATATIIANLQARSNAGAIVAFAVGNAFEAVLFAWIFERLDKASGDLESLGSVASFFVAAVIAPAIAALPAAATLHGLQLSTSPILELWTRWFVADCVGIVAFAPLVMTLRRAMLRPPAWAMLAEGFVALCVLGVATFYSFGVTADTTVLPEIAPASALLPVLLWIGGRTPLVFSAIGAFIIGLIVVLLAINGYGRFGDTAVHFANRIATTQLAIVTACAFALTLAAMFARLRNTTDELRSSDERLRLALGAAGMYAFDLDFVEGKVHRVGDLIEKLGLSSIGYVEDYVRALHPEERIEFEEILASLSTASPRFMRRVRLRTVDGDYIVVAHRAEAKFDASGRKTRVVGTCVDVTRRWVAEEALRESEDRLRNALTAGRVFAFEVDTVLGTVKRSENAVEILGIPPERLNMSRDEFLELIHSGDRVEFTSSRATLSPANPSTHVRTRFDRPDGRLAWLETSERGEFDANGQLIRVRGLTRDITERMLAEENQAKLIKELDHRVKNSLTRVDVMIKRTRQEHESVDSFVRDLDGRVTAMLRTHERLSASRWSGVNLKAIVEDELKPYRTSANISIEGPDLVLSPKAAQAFSFTLHELATNAAKYGGLATPQGRVSVGWTLAAAPAAALDRGGRLHLTWSEPAASGIAPPKVESYGTATIRGLLRHETGARVELKFEPAGFVCEIDADIDRLTELQPDTITPVARG